MRTTSGIQAGVFAIMLATLPVLGQAASLGKLTVLSAVGQPFKAEIDLSVSSPEELETLKAQLASPQAYRAARVDYPLMVGNLSVSIQKRSDGRPYLRVLSSQPVAAPNLDLLLEVHSNAGKTVREYTALIDPVVHPVERVQTVQLAENSTPAAQPQAKAIPLAKAEAPPPPAAATEGPTPVPAIEPQASSSTESAAASAPELMHVAKADAPTKASAEPRASAATKRKTKSKYRKAPKHAGQYVVKKGDTLSGIAQNLRPSGVTLEQMLVALYRDNPRAFRGNMNRLKRGVTLQRPTSAHARSVPQPVAVKEVQAQTGNWSAYRQELSNAVAGKTARKTRPSASKGQIGARAGEHAAPEMAPGKDVLKLSKGAEQGNPKQLKSFAEEDATAKRNALEEARSRVQALEQNKHSMQRLIEMKDQAAASVPDAAKLKPEVKVEPKPEPKPEPKKPDVPKEEKKEKEQDSTLISPAVLAGGGGVIALGTGAALWLMRRRKQQAEEASARKRATTETVFGGDTKDSAAPVAETPVAPSAQDALAEAETRIALGDLSSAETVLKEALKADPTRQDIRLKLLEVYFAQAKQTEFEQMAIQMRQQLKDNDPLWQRAAKMGRDLDPQNPLYQQGQTASGAVDASASSNLDFALGAAVGGAALQTVASAEAAQDIAFPDFNLETLDQGAEPTFDLPALSQETGDTLPGLSEDSLLAVLPEDDPKTQISTMMDLDLSDTGMLQSPAPELPTRQKDLLEANPEPPARPEPNPNLPKIQEDHLEELALPIHISGTNAPESKDSFAVNLGDDALPGIELEKVSLDKPNHLDAIDSPLDFGSNSDDPIATKLDLARAYIEMGDAEGAREVLDEAMEEGSPEQQSAARALLATLSHTASRS